MDDLNKCDTFDPHLPCSERISLDRPSVFFVIFNSDLFFARPSFHHLVWRQYLSLIKNQGLISTLIMLTTADCCRSLEKEKKKLHTRKKLEMRKEKKKENCLQVSLRVCGFLGINVASVVHFWGVTKPLSSPTKMPAKSHPSICTRMTSLPRPNGVILLLFGFPEKSKLA